MLFVNKGKEKVPVRIEKSKWKWIKPDEEIDIPQEYGKKIGLVPKTVESKAGTKKVETKVLVTDKPKKRKTKKKK